MGGDEKASKKKTKGKVKIPYGLPGATVAERLKQKEASLNARKERKSQGLIDLEKAENKQLNIALRRMLQAKEDKRLADLVKKKKKPIEE